MMLVLEDATATLPESKRTSAIKAEMASNILAGAAKGERNPEVLKMRALLTVVDVSHLAGAPCGLGLASGVVAKGRATYRP
jgi:hypothetical protein